MTSLDPLNFKKGDKVKGQIKSITSFGVFIGLPGGIDGLVHLSDLSWTLPGDEAVRKYETGSEVEAVVVAIDVERERVALGIKQLTPDPWSKRPGDPEAPVEVVPNKPKPPTPLSQANNP
jgi:small subunit ribosomal protein S1